MVLAILVLGLILVFTTAWSPVGTMAQSDTDDTWEPAFEVDQIDGDLLKTQLDHLPADRDGLVAAVQKVYRERQYQPIWFQDGTPLPVANRLAATLNRCPVDTPFPPDARPERIEVAMRWVPKAPVSTETLTQLEQTFTRAYVACLMGAKGEEEIRAKSFGWSYEEPALADPLLTFAKLVDDGLTPGELTAGLDELLPPHPQVELLNQAARRYAEIVAAGGWPMLAEGETLEADQAADPKRLDQLAERLAAEGYLDADFTARDAYSGQLLAAVREFQQVHGLNTDAKVGPETLEALRVPAINRLDSILVNLNRARWLPKPLEDRREVWVNLPAAHLEVVEYGEPTIEMRVIVGKSTWETPVFQDQIEYLVVHPAWNVPASIVEDETRHKFGEDTQKMVARGFEVYESPQRLQRLDPTTIDWANVDPKSIHVRQAPGAYNSLGKIKFAMPNDSSIYLHDTSARRLFAKEERSLSHGCIRVEEPIELALELFPEDAEKITRGLQEGRRKTIDVTRDAPVHLFYMTAWVRRDGRVSFYDDVYSRDRILANQVAELRNRSRAVPARLESAGIDVDEAPTMRLGAVDAEAADEGRVPAGFEVVLDDA